MASVRWVTPREPGDDRAAEVRCRRGTLLADQPTQPVVSSPNLASDRFVSGQPAAQSLNGHRVQRPEGATAVLQTHRPVAEGAVEIRAAVLVATADEPEPFLVAVDCHIVEPLVAADIERVARAAVANRCRWWSARPGNSAPARPAMICSSAPGVSDPSSATRPSAIRQSTRRPATSTSRNSISRSWRTTPG